MHQQRLRVLVYGDDTAVAEEAALGGFI